MGKEYIDYGYTGTISLPKEIKNMHTAIIRIGGIALTARQLGMLTGAIVLAFGSFKLMNSIGLPGLDVLLPVLLAAPLILLAFVRINGLDFDDWMVVQFCNKHLSSSIRKNNILNEYEKLEEMYDQAMRKGKKQKRKKVKSVHKAFR